MYLYTYGIHVHVYTKLQFEEDTSYGEYRAMEIDHCPKKREGILKHDFLYVTPLGSTCIYPNNFDHYWMVD